MNAMKSWLAVVFLTGSAVASAAEEIRYFDGKGAALDVSAAIRTGALARRQIHVRYADGSHVLVNGNCGVPGVRASVTFREDDGTRKTVVVEAKGTEG